MIVKELLNPRSIVVVGASNDITKPGGRLLKNLLSGGFNGDIYTVNPKESMVQGIDCYPSVDSIPDSELAIIAVAAKFIPDTMETLVQKKGTKAFIILSAGFSEIGGEGKILEEKIVEIAENAGATLIGPNCIGILNTNYKGVFAGPIPKLEPTGCDCVSGSGATLCFILESAIPRGLTFSSIYSVGNSAQVGVEDILEYWDETFDPQTSSKIKLIYIEKIDNAQRLLKHASSLINKGCQIAAIKAGTTEAGSRAVSSHTGALAGSDSAVDALFKKAGIVRCYNRTELIDVAIAFSYKQLNGENIAVVTHAGGPGVMLTDTLSANGMKVPHITGANADELLSKLYPGSSVANPIDFLATGTADQLGLILDTIENKFDNIDGTAVIFGTTGMFDVTEVYRVLSSKIDECLKPIYPVLPSVVLTEKETEFFKSTGKAFYPDETALGRALAKIYQTPKPAQTAVPNQIDIDSVRNVIDSAKNGYLEPIQIQMLLDAAGINRVKESVVFSTDETLASAAQLGFPLVMKVVGPVHKSDVGGVVLNVRTADEVAKHFEGMMKIKDAKGVLLQQMLSGMELFIGAKKEPKFGHIILCGLGGIFIEVLKDVSSGLAPLTKQEAIDMIHSLKGYKLIQGVRGQEGIDEDIFAEQIVKLSGLLAVAPEIAEMDINPLLGRGKNIIAVDARIRIEK